MIQWRRVGNIYTAGLNIMHISYPLNTSTCARALLETQDTPCSPTYSWQHYVGRAQLCEVWSTLGR